MSNKGDDTSLRACHKPLGTCAERSIVTFIGFRFLRVQLSKSLGTCTKRSIATLDSTHSIRSCVFLAAGSENFICKGSF
jgi:hypothetical protein